MKRLLFVLATMLALVLMPEIVHADPSSGAYNFAVGGGTDNTGEHFAFSAHCQVAGSVVCDQTTGTKPTGHVVYKVCCDANRNLIKLSGPVTCLLVQGNSATITFYTPDLNSLTPGSPYVTFSVVNNGPPVKGQPVDTASHFQVISSDPNWCSHADATELGSQVPIASGNIVVNQGSVLP